MLAKDALMVTQMSECVWTVDENTTRIARCIPCGVETASTDAKWQCCEQVTAGAYQTVKWASGSREFEFTLTAFLANTLTYTY